MNMFIKTLKEAMTKMSVFQTDMLLSRFNEGNNWSALVKRDMMASFAIDEAHYLLALCELVGVDGQPLKDELNKLILVHLTSVSEGQRSGWVALNDPASPYALQELMKAVRFMPVEHLQSLEGKTGWLTGHKKRVIQEGYFPVDDPLRIGAHRFVSEKETGWAFWRSL